MVDTDRPVELFVLAGVGVCLYCGLDQLATPDEEPHIGSVAFCGGCAGLHWLDGRVGDEGHVVPYLRKPDAQLRLELMASETVRAVRDAYKLDQIEASMRASSAKRKRPSPPPRTGGRARLGRNRLEAKGPDAR